MAPAVTITKRPLHTGLLGVAAALVLAATLASGCASRPYRPPPVDSLLSHQSVLQGVGRQPPGGGEGLVPISRRVQIATARGDIVSLAGSMAGQEVPMVNGRGYRADCSGFVAAVYASVGIDLYAEAGSAGLNGVSVIQRYVGERGGLHGRRPLPGDIVFFDGTHGPRGARLTHVGIVESVEEDGTVVFLHHMQGRIVRGRLNRFAPSEHRCPETGKILNDYLRRGAHGPRMAGELFAGYGTVIR